MRTRDEFAKAAPQVCVAEFFRPAGECERHDASVLETGWPWTDYDEMAQSCYHIADAMMRARKPKPVKTGAIAEVDVATATVAWDACCQTINRTKAERGAVMCEYESPEEYGDCGNRTAPANDPCWKSIGSDENGGPHYSPQSTWCASCRKRQGIHEEWRAAKKAHGPLLRRVRMLARRLVKQVQAEQIARDTR